MRGERRHSAEHAGNFSHYNRELISFDLNCIEILITKLVDNGFDKEEFL
jgi:hypothetical protein